MQTDISFRSFSEAKVSLAALKKATKTFFLSMFIVPFSVEIGGREIKTVTAVPNYCGRHGAVNSKITTGNFLFLGIFHTDLFWRKVLCKKCKHSFQVHKIGEYPK